MFVSLHKSRFALSSQRLFNAKMQKKVMLYKDIIIVSVALGITLHCVAGRYVSGLASRSASISPMLHRVWLRIRFATRSTALMHYSRKKSKDLVSIEMGCANKSLAINQ